MELTEERQLCRSQAPVIDLGPLRVGTRQAREGVARQVVDACREIGFFYIVDHGVPAALFDAMFESAQAFFALPLEEKMAISMTLRRDYRGYMPIR